MSTAARVIRNTGYLYAKMGITMFISLYTTRLILGSLGASDFGIFNIVGGAIAMLGFLNAAMASATQRFMSYSEGEGDREKQKRIFNISVVLHFLLALVVGVALVVAGWFFFHGILNIPEGRVFAAQVVYGSLIVSTMFTVMSVPYDAVLNAHENMLYYAVVGIVESVLKLAVALATVYILGDRLIVYGILMACIPLVTLTIMRVYCHRNYAECTLHPRRYWDGPLMREMGAFAGWNFVSNAAAGLTMHGMSLVLNYFWGVLANAAHGIANQLSGQVMVFSRTMLKALNPVIVKKEGAYERKKMLEFSMTGNKLSFVILSFIAIPFIIEMPYILDIWLKEPPEYTILFCRLVFVRLMIGQMSITFGTCVSATGKIKKVTIYETCIWSSIIPLSIFVYWLGAPIQSIYYLLIALVLARDTVMVYFTNKICGLNIMQFVKTCVITCVLSSAITMLAGYFITFVMPVGLPRLLATVATTTILFAFLCYFFCFNKVERELIQKMMKQLKNRISHTNK